MSAVTDTNGNFVIPNLVPGQYSVAVTPPAGYQAPAPQTVTLATGESKTVNFVLNPTPGTIQGSVKNAAGAPLVSVTVTATKL